MNTNIRQAETTASPKEKAVTVLTTFPSEYDWVKVFLSTLILVSFGVVLLALPLSNLLHPSAWQRFSGFWHSLFACFSIAIFIASGLQALPLYRGTVMISRVRWLTCLSAALSVFTLVSGLIAQARYQAPVADAAGVYIQAVTPLMQSTMVWHQLTSLSIFGLSLSSFYCLWLYGDLLLQPQAPYPQIRLSICLGLAWLLLFGLSNFIGGIALAKIHSL